MHLCFGLAAAILAYHPVLWLTQTWTDPSYDSQGVFVFGLCAAMFFWSASSPKLSHKPINPKLPLLLLGGSAFVRLLGQVFAINIIGALTLIIDVFALATLCGLNKRKRALSPLWLAITFGFSLPLERVLQRTIGYGLQHLSADGACSVLSGMFEKVQCSGIRILIDTQDVLVDLPCSGARSFLLMLCLFFICAAFSRLTIKHAFIGLLVTVAAAYAMNVIRITALASFIAYPQLIGGLDVMAQPTHDILGLVFLALGSLPIFWISQKFARSPKHLHSVLDRAVWVVPSSLRKDGWWLTPHSLQEKSQPQPLRIAMAWMAVLSALLIVNLPREAVDVAKRDIPLVVPSMLNSAHAQGIPLLPKEAAYFTQYGGSAQKAQYGDHGLMLVRTSAPLRHLHAPDECLRGLGMKVEYKGVDYAGIPTAIYKATDPLGQSYRIAVSFISEDQSVITTNVAEAVWLWMNGEHTTWTAVQRISSWDAAPGSTAQFDHAVIAALELSPASQSIQLAMEGHSP